MSIIGRAELDCPQVTKLLDLKGRTAVVTGANGGIGSTIATRLAEAGACVVLQCRGKGNHAHETVAKLSEAEHNARAVSCELRSAEDAHSLLKESENLFGTPTILINSIGSYHGAPIQGHSTKEWRASIEANLDTAFFCVQAAGATMAFSGGAIVLVASISAHSPAPEQASYNAAKAGVLSLMRSAAQEFGRLNVRVNAVSLGLIYREGIEQEWPEGIARWTV